MESDMKCWYRQLSKSNRSSSIAMVTVIVFVNQCLVESSSIWPHTTATANPTLFLLKPMWECNLIMRCMYCGWYLCKEQVQFNTNKDRWNTASFHGLKSIPSTTLLGADSWQSANLAKSLEGGHWINVVTAIKMASEMHAWTTKFLPNQTPS